MNIVTRIAAQALFALAPVVASVPAQAQQYPNRPITLVNAFAAGSLTDIVARILATDLGNVLKQTVVVENKPGGSQTIAGSYVARANPDGYTIYMANMPAIVAPSVQATLPFQGVRDFTAVAAVVSVRLFMYVAPEVKGTTLQEVVSTLKAEPGKYNYGSSGVASPIHLIAEMFNAQAGVKTTHVPYKGSNEVLQSLVSNQIGFAFLGSDGMQFVNKGQLKAVGIAATKRDKAMPNIPTMDEAGLKGFSPGVDFVVVVPKGTPADVVAKLNSAINEVTASEAFTKRMAQRGGLEIAPPGTPAQAASYIANQENMWDGIVKSANIKLE